MTASPGLFPEQFVLERRRKHVQKLTEKLKDVFYAKVPAYYEGKWSWIIEETFQDRFFKWCWNMLWRKDVGILKRKLLKALSCCGLSASWRQAELYDFLKFLWAWRLWNLTHIFRPHSCFLHLLIHSLNVCWVSTTCLLLLLLLSRLRRVRLCGTP